MNNIASKSIIMLTISLCAYSCSVAHNDFSQYLNLPPEGWAYTDTLTFLPDIPDTTASGRLVLSIRHDNEYPYSNLWIEVTTMRPDSSEKADTVNFLLANQYGRWYGQGFGASYQISDTLPAVMTLTDSLSIKVRHIMRIDTVRNIEQLGVSFVSIDNNKQ